MRVNLKLEVRDMVINSLKKEDTYEIGKELGMKAEPGDIVCLLGDLGVGKTIFAQGFAQGLGIEEPINSPTFTIIQQYDDGRLPFYHFDVYRIADIEEMDEIGYEDCFYGNGVCLIEWANIIKEILPPTIKTVLIEKDIEKYEELGFDYRKITIREGSL